MFSLLFRTGESSYRACFSFHSSYSEVRRSCKLKSVADPWLAQSTLHHLNLIPCKFHVKSWFWFCVDSTFWGSLTCCSLSVTPRQCSWAIRGTADTKRTVKESGHLTQFPDAGTQAVLCHSCQSSFCTWGFFPWSLECHVFLVPLVGHFPICNDPDEMLKHCVMCWSAQRLWWLAEEIQDVVKNAVNV